MALSRKNSTIYWLEFLLLAAIPMLFLPLSWAHRSSLAKALLDAGHLLLFMGLTHAVLRRCSTPGGGRELAKEMAWVLLIALVLGGGVEIIQAFLPGRSASLSDLFKDGCGAMLGFLLARPQARTWLSLAVTGSAMLIALAPLAAVLIDLASAYARFPVLYDFENPLELTHIRASADFSRDGAHPKAGSHALLVSCRSRRYSGVSFTNFPGDWRGFTHFEASVYNPGPQEFTLHVKIYDQQHRAHGLAYRDRYNGRFSLKPGWNTIAIPLAAIQQAPANRQMQLSHIDHLAFFTSRPRKGLQFSLDSIKLVTITNKGE